MTNDLNLHKKDLPHNKNPRRAGSACPLGGFTGDEEFYPEYVDSLTEGDIRPIVIKDYVEEKE